MPARRRIAIVVIVVLLLRLGHGDDLFAAEFDLLEHVEIALHQIEVGHRKALFRPDGALLDMLVDAEHRQRLAFRPEALAGLLVEGIGPHGNGRKDEDRQQKHRRKSGTGPRLRTNEHENTYDVIAARP